MPSILLVDISNTYTKTALSDGDSLTRLSRVSTARLSKTYLRLRYPLRKLDAVVIASVVPAKTAVAAKCAKGRVIEVGPRTDLGIGISYPRPNQIGPDRLANAAAANALHGAPCIVVDFGTAVTFDVISAESKYIGGIIAPGLNAMTDYLHEKTALLPRIRIEEPPRVVGRSTREAMLSGAVHGYRGLIATLVRQITLEAFPKYKPHLVATGGDARLIAAGLPLFDTVEPLLTLQGLRLIARRELGISSG